MRIRVLREKEEGGELVQVGSIDYRGEQRGDLGGGAKGAGLQGNGRKKKKGPYE